MSNTTNWLMLIVGPFVGAMLAFISAMILDEFRRQRENLVSANIALFLIKNQYNDYLLFRKGFLEEIGRTQLVGDEPLWLLARPMFLTFCDYKFEFKSLGFLFEQPGNSSVFEEVELVQIRHRDLFALLKLYTENAVFLQSTVAKFIKSKPTLQEIESELGLEVTNKIQTFIIGLGIRAENDESAYLKAFSTLRDALEDELKSHWFINFFKFTLWCRRKPIHVKLKDPLPHFRRAELPAMPKQLAQAVASALLKQKGEKINGPPEGAELKGGFAAGPRAC